MTTTVRHVALCDGSGDFPEPLETTLPDAGLAGPWRLHVHCHLLFVDSRVALVDTGTGPPWAPAATWFPRPGGLLEALGIEGVSAADVTDVVFTHLHSDHVGWSVHGDPAAPSPTFPNARHLVQQVELARLSAGTPGQRALHDSHLRPLVDAGLIEAVDGGATPLPNVSLVPTPGHTAGHQSVAVDRSDTTLLISGDVFVHPAQVTDPSVGYVYEDDPAEAIRTRRRVLADAAVNRTLLATAHFEATTVLIEVGADGAGLRPVQTCAST